MNQTNWAQKYLTLFENVRVLISTDLHIYSNGMLWWSNVKSFILPVLAYKVFDEQANHRQNETRRVRVSEKAN